MKKLMGTKPDGTVSIIHLVDKTVIEKQLGIQMSDAEYESYIPAGLSNVRPISESDIPKDRKYRDAWVDATPLNRVDVSCEKVKEILLKEIRDDREPKLAENDKKYIQALKTGENTDQILAERQMLLDCTEELKAVDVIDIYNDDNLIADMEKLIK